MHARSVSVFMLCAALALPAPAQQVIIYPAKGQSPAQQNKDEGECAVWARQSTGIDPVAVAQTPTPTGPTGPAVGGGERVAGAARGAIVGEIAGEHAGEGAAIGAMAGGARARRHQAAERQQVQQQAQQDKNAKINTYNRAVGACMQGRGYTVK